jgi:hypothetical protein
LFFCLNLLLVINQPAMAITFGCGYVNPASDEFDWHRLAKMYRDIGVHAVKIQHIRWSDVEPNPPRKGRHKYKWDILDRLVFMLQSEGFREIEVVLEAASDWGNRKLEKRDKEGKNIFQRQKPSLPPAKGYWKDYAAFISNIVERYDGDGKRDMPGLKYPVEFFEIETEAQGSYHWFGTPEEYARLLKFAYKAAKKANPNVQIVLTGLWVGDVVQSDTSCKERTKLIDEQWFSKSNWRKYCRAFDVYFKQGKYFDAVEFHSLENYTVIEQAVNWIRQKMQANGYDKPIYIGDGCVVPTMTYGPVIPHPHPFKLTAHEIVKILAKKRDDRYEIVHGWYRAEQSRLVVKKSVMAMAMGLPKINLGFLMDNPRAEGPIMKLTAKFNPLAYNWLIAGLVDRNYNPYPAFYTYKLTIEKLKDASFVKRLPLKKEAYGYEFAVGDKKLYVLWSEQQTTVDLPVDRKYTSAQLTKIITEFSQKEAVVDKIAVQKGTIRLAIGPDPYFLEPIAK